MPSRREFPRVPPSDDFQASAQDKTARTRPDDLSQSAHAALMLHLSRRAMACDFELCFPVGSGDAETQLALETLESLENLEEQLSFFRPTSEINRINLLAAEAPVAVEPELFRLLCLAGDLWRQTDGALDITATPLWQAWGFARRAGAVPAEEEISLALSRVGFQFVQLDAEQDTIRFTRPGVQLNLGSMGKGYALDRCAAKLIEGGMKHFRLHAGKSSILAHGSEKGEAALNLRAASPLPFWTIGIPHPRRPKQRIGEIRLRNRAMATSSSQFQSFRHKGKFFGHIIDPRTGHPAEGMLSATVVAPSAVLADALSTAFYVLGLEKSLAFCQAHPEIGAVLLIPSSRGKNFHIHLAGLDDRDFVPL
jgi:thiamine biosynthesis lipoprotein